MKIDYIKALLSVLISALLAYAFYSINDYEGTKWLLTIVSFIELSLMGVLTFGVEFEESRTSVMLAVLSVTCLMVAAGMNLIFSFFDFNTPTYIILNGLLVAIFLLVYVSVHKSHQ